MSHQQNTAFFLLGSWTAQSGFFFFAPEAGKVHAHTEYLYLVALEESSYFPLLHMVSKKRREDLMNKRCHFTLYDKSQEQQGKLFNTSYSGSCQPLSVQHTMLQQWKQGQPAFFRFFVVFFFGGGGRLMIYWSVRIFCFFLFWHKLQYLSQALQIPFLKHTHIIRQTGTKIWVGREMGKSRKDICIKERLQPWNIYHLLQIIKGDSSQTTHYK